MTDKTQHDHSDDETHEYPADGPWRAIVRSRDRATYYPRNPSKLARLEWTLPSGQVLIDDISEGYVLRSVYSAAFNIDTRSVVGRPLGDRAVMKRQSENAPWFVSWYQEVYDSEDQLTSSRLLLVEEHRGRELVGQHEFASDETSADTPPNYRMNRTRSQR